jgi:hypothetical protein
MTDISTRPNCPVCKQATLTGAIFKRSNDTMATVCNNPECGARVILTRDLDIIRAEVHYWPSGERMK